MLQIMPQSDNKYLKKKKKSSNGLVNPFNPDICIWFGKFSISVFFLFLLSLRRDIKQWHSQKGLKNQKEQTLNKQTDGNNSNKAETGVIHSLKNMLHMSRKHKLSSEILN